MLKLIILFLTLQEFYLIDCRNCIDSKTQNRHQIGEIFRKDDNKVCDLCQCSPGGDLVCFQRGCSHLNCAKPNRAEFECCRHLRCESKLNFNIDSILGAPRETKTGRIVGIVFVVILCLIIVGFLGCFAVCLSYKCNIYSLAGGMRR